MRFYADDPYNRIESMKVVTDLSMVEQFRFARSKGKRIKKKYLKDPSNFRPSQHALVDKARGWIVCHPAVADVIRQQIPQRRPVK